MSQLNLFSAALNNETRAFNGAVAARNAHDFFTVEYSAAQTKVDAHYSRVQSLQGCVPWHQWP